MARSPQMTSQPELARAPEPPPVTSSLLAAGLLAALRRPPVTSSPLAAGLRAAGLRAALRRPPEAQTTLQAGAMKGSGQARPGPPSAPGSTSSIAPPPGFDPGSSDVPWRSR